MSVSFIQISDCHIDDETLVMGVDSKSNLDKVLEHINAKPFDALLISGDLTHNGTPSSYKTLQKSLGSINAEVYVMPGNHDNKTNLSNAFNSDLQKGFQLGEWNIITLDSVQENKVSGLLNNKQCHFLTEALNDCNGRHTIVCLHHPIVPMQSNWDDELSLDNPEDLFAIIDKHPHVKAVLWGHAHESKVFDYNNVKLFSCPSTALQFNGPDKIGYNHYTLHDNGSIECKTEWL